MNFIITILLILASPYLAIAGIIVSSYLLFWAITVFTIVKVFGEIILHDLCTSLSRKKVKT